MTLTHPWKHFKSRFPVNIFCDVVECQVIGPFALQERLTSERYLRFLEDELPVLLEMFLSTSYVRCDCSKRAQTLILVGR